MKTILCFGDSNTHGYRVDTGGRFSFEERWTGKLQELLGPGYHVIEEGLSGRTTVFDDPLFEGLNGLRAIYPCLMTHEPVSLLIIMLGTNDVKARFACNPGNIAKGLSRLVRKAIHTTDAWEKGPNILIVCPPPIEAGYASSDVGPEMGEGCDGKSRQLAGLYEKTAQELGCHFLDAGSIEGMHMNTIDYMHLTADGHARLAGALAERIPDLI